jgi:hypothetical protein
MSVKDCRPVFASFSPEAGCAVRFHRLHQANAMRSKIDGVAKAT